MSKETAVELLKTRMEQVQGLLKDPQPGLITWNEIFEDKLKDMGIAIKEILKK